MLVKMNGKWLPSPESFRLFPHVLNQPLNRLQQNYFLLLDLCGVVFMLSPAHE